MKERLQAILQESLHRLKLARENKDRAFSKYRAATEEVETIIELIKREKGVE